MRQDRHGRSVVSWAWMARCVAVAACLGAAVPGGPARAQLLNQLQNAIGGGTGGGAGALGGALPAVNQASPLNIAGVLQYCIQNSLIGGGASSVQSSLLGHVGGASATSNPQYSAGTSGLLQTGQGQGVNLAGGGLVADLKQKVCDLVLQQAKSLL